jgi:hypothetical protein
VVKVRVRAIADGGEPIARYWSACQGARRAEGQVKFCRRHYRDEAGCGRRQSELLGEALRMAVNAKPEKMKG